MQVPSRDLVEYRSALEVVKDNGVIRFDDLDLEVGKHVYECYRWTGGDLASPEGETVWTMTFTRGDWSVRTVTQQLLTAPAPSSSSTRTKATTASTPATGT